MIPSITPLFLWTAENIFIWFLLYEFKCYKEERESEEYLKNKKIKNKSSNDKIKEEQFY